MKIFDRQETAKSANLLIHACCGPCLEWPLQQLLDEGFKPLIYFYNPNIQPAVENQRRLKYLRQLTENRNLPCLSDSICKPEIWTDFKSNSESRCEMCYRCRMTAAAGMASQLGTPAFTTTLLVSPYQDHEEIIAAGLKAGEQFNVEFISRDFRPGFRDGQRMARKDELYRQKYCGCLPSLEKSDFRDKIKQEHQDLLEQP